MITAGHPSSQLEADQDAQVVGNCEVSICRWQGQLSLLPPLHRVSKARLHLNWDFNARTPLRAVNCLSPALASPGVNYSELAGHFHGWSFQTSAAAFGKDRRGWETEFGTRKATRRKERRRHTEIMTGEGSGQRRWYNAGGTLCEHCVILPPYTGGTTLSAIPLLSPHHLPLSLKPWHDRRGGKHMEGKGQTTRSSWDPFFGCLLLKHNKTTWGTHSVKTPLSPIAQQEPKKD